MFQGSRLKENSSLRNVSKITSNVQERIQYNWEGFVWRGGHGVLHKRREGHQRCTKTNELEEVLPESEKKVRAGQSEASKLWPRCPTGLLIVENKV